jgi:Flp pilus assembly protein CpaB
LGAAAALAVVCGALFVLLYQSAGSRHPFLAVARPVASGQVVAPSDLTTVRVTSDSALSPIPADEAGLVVGRHAAVALVPGTLLTPADLASGPAVGAGDASVGLDLKASQLPAGLEPGDSVLVIETPGQSQVSSQASSGTTTLLTQATVLSITPPPSDSPTGDTAVTLIVSTGEVVSVVEASSAGQISLAGLGPKVTAP